MREELRLLLGPYEAGAPACYVDGRRRKANMNFPGDLERLTPLSRRRSRACRRSAKSASKKIYNGAIAYTPDGSPIVGPAPGLRNFWLNEGHSFASPPRAAPAGNWPNGSPRRADHRHAGCRSPRFGPMRRPASSSRKRGVLRQVFSVHYPDEERGRRPPLRQTPCYGRMRDLGAVFGAVYGWERPNFFAPPAYSLSDADLEKPDVLLRNHPPVVGNARPREK